MEEIVYYFIYNLKNKKAAEDFIQEILYQEKNILTFPYGVSEYKTVKNLKYKYRRINVKNFYMFYVIDEDRKIVTISRVFSKKNKIFSKYLYIKEIYNFLNDIYYFLL